MYCRRLFSFNPVDGSNATAIYKAVNLQCPISCAQMLLQHIDSKQLYLIPKPKAQ
jgi:hypothetical protein